MTYDENNIFAKMIRGDMDCDKVYEDDHVLAFNDIAPAAPTHVLVIPKGNYISFDDFASNGNTEEVKTFFTTVQKIATEILGLQESGYRLICNHGPDSSQAVHHFHVHILGGRPLGGLVSGDALVR